MSIVSPSFSSGQSDAVDVSSDDDELLVLLGLLSLPFPLGAEHPASRIAAATTAPAFHMLTRMASPLHVADDGHRPPQTSMPKGQGDARWKLRVASARLSRLSAFWQARSHPLLLSRNPRKPF